MSTLPQGDALLGLDYGVWMLTLLTSVTFSTMANIYLLFKVHRLNRLYNMMMLGASGASLESMILGRIREIEQLKQDAAELRNQCKQLDEEGRQHIQKLGVVRYNAFDNTGSDLSFSVALLDAMNSGVVLSGIYGREESRVYAKPVLNGTSNYMLTLEEKQAMESAQKK